LFYRPWPLYAFGLGVCLLNDFLAEPVLRLPNDILLLVPADLAFAIIVANF
jgi:hypothetical protein